MKTKKSRSKKKGTGKEVVVLSPVEVAELSNVLKNVDMDSSPARVLSAIKSSSRFFRSSLDRGDKIRFVTTGGYLGVHPPAKLRQIALNAT